MGFDSKDLEAELKNNMLVVATLIVAVTFQTGFSPPGGAWQGTEGGHEARKAIMASLKVSYHMFLILNSLAFSIYIYSAHLILVYHEIVVATVSMAATYGTAVWSLSPHKDVKLRYVSMVALFPYLWRLSYQTFKSFRSCKQQQVDRS
ncbi:hypothetical protein EZV62_009476 [Acer yangbiense]|uniref:PGG domain-containing protein n=1 Tax=Acer yangbiense TaxID=1000413 RepID=A0A5C7I243_9ROSI|nr:hypothetical protein EZV62_009476 [Acer yangbiense]